MKNFLIRLFVCLVKPLLPKHRGDRFLIVTTTGLGDTLWGTPAIRVLREAYPQAYIAVLTSPLGKQVLQNNPHINEIFVTKTAPVLILFKRKISTIFVFHTSQRAVLPFCALLGAVRIVGTEKMNKGLDFLLTDLLPLKKHHEIERRLEIVAQVGCPISSRLMEFFPSSSDKEKAASLMPPGIVIGLHPGAKDKFKQWTPSHFIGLGQKLKKHLQCQIVITGTPPEKELVETIASAIEGAIPIYEHISIPTLAAIVDKLALYITNDTGPLHVACTTKTPTIALFTPTDAQLCGPYFASHVKVIQKQPTCSPCSKKKCHDAFCMLQISPDEVYQEALKLL
ncbi:MAG TPA: glycosyltransferase family 9 protein [Rhabdochlamydiaceae bacterium]|jgi:ADP-heptose:LPS heptosyltransferase|nr:glycosyltransferase family 9 protein [Rhabdochlamydiaceae bacterium]